MRFLPRFFFLALLAGALALWGAGLSGPPLALFRLLVLLLAAALAARWARSPLREVEAAARRLSMGDFAARLDDVTAGDDRPAGEAFNRMAHSFVRTLREAEERGQRLEAVLDASDRAILLLGADGTVLKANPACRRLFPPFRPEAGLGGLGLPGLPARVQEALDQRSVLTFELCEREGGSERTFEARITPLERGEAVVHLRDLTPERTLERVKADLVANVSHELRTPLTALLSLAEVLDDPALPEERRRHFLGRLKAQATRMQRLLEDLLTLSRLEEEGPPPLREVVDLGAMAEDLASALEGPAEEAKVRLQVEVPRGLTLHADPLLLESVLKNLLDNAVRYNRPGGEVLLRARDGGAFAEITVSDTGEGIPARHLPRIFERFYRVDAHRSREKGGTGLGLAIVKHAVQRMGGEVSVESTVGAGTTFTVRLPLPQAAP
ncbi:MAG: HAMP domain-containing sensor histidine kinase [Acidobacteriota bacterium]